MKNNIRKICKEKKMTMSKVIENAGMSKSQVHDIANGDFVPSILNARKISNALGVTLEEVFPEEIKEEENE